MAWCEPRHALLALLGSVTLLGPIAASAQGWMTIEDAVLLFRRRGFDLLLADLAIEWARAERTQAAAVANPQLDGGLGRSFGYDPRKCLTPGCSATAWSAGLSEQGALFDALVGKRGLRIRGAEAALGAAAADRRDVQRTLEPEVRRQYLEAVYAGDALELATVVAASYARTLELNRVRWRAGAIAETEVLRVEVAALEAQQETERAAQAVDEARAQLGFLLGFRGRVPDLRLQPDLPAFVVPRAVASIDGDALAQRALALRPDVASARHQRDQAAAQLRLAERLRVPDIELSLRGTGQGTGQSAITPPTLTFNLSLAPPLFYQHQGEIAAARADLRTQEVALARVEAQVLADVTTAVAALRFARRRVERMQTALLERARRARDLVLFQYEKGAAPLLEYLDAERTYFADRQEHLRDLTDYWIAFYALEAAVGETLR